MRIGRVLGLLVIAIFFCGCVRMPKPADTRVNRAYGYYPIDPLEVFLPEPTGGATNKLSEVWNRYLQDETTRIAVGRLTGEGQVVYGPFAIGGAGTNYNVVVDYIKYTTKSALFEFVPDTRPSSSADEVRFSA